MAANLKANRLDFKALEYIVYPAHGVGQIEAIEKQEVAGQKLELFVIRFERDRMNVKVPVNKAIALGMRKLVDAIYKSLFYFKTPSNQTQSLT